MAAPPRPPHRPRPAPTFRPEFTLLLVYFFVFFVVFALLLALPALLDGLRDLPAAASLEEERAAGARIAQQAVARRLGWALAAAFVAIVLGAYTRALPGIKRIREP